MTGLSPWQRGPQPSSTCTRTTTPGWVATVRGHQLRAVRLDGWQQGWVLPSADASEEVTLRFVPDSSFRAGLVVGAAIALALVACVVLTLRRPRKREGVRSTVSRQHVSTPSEQQHLVSCQEQACTVHAASRPLDGGDHLLRLRRGGPRGGRRPGLCRSRAPRAAPRCAGLGRGGAEVLAGVAIAVHPGYRIGVLAGSGSYTAQALGALALAALAVSLLPSFDTTAEA